MTEQEWLECDDLYTMLAFLRNRDCGRKLRLFAVASCRPILHRLTDERSRTAVHVAERVADGQAAEAERCLAENAAVSVISAEMEVEDRAFNEGRRMTRSQFYCFGEAAVNTLCSHPVCQQL